MAELNEGIKRFLLEYNKKATDLQTLSLKDRQKLVDSIIDGNPSQSLEGEEWNIEWNGRQIPILIYRPEIEDDVPIFIFLHGGATIYNTNVSRQKFCKLISETANVLVIAVSYKETPQFQFPEAIEDGLAVIEWILADEFRLWNPQKIILAGEGAGGNIANAISMRHNKSNHEIPIYKQFLLSPILDLVSLKTPSYKSYETGYFLEKWMIEEYRYNYINDESELMDPLVSPLYLSDFRSIPPTTIITTEFDILHDEGKEYSVKLKQQGVTVNYHELDGVIHNFLSLQAWDPIVEKNMSKILEIIKTNLL